MALLDMPRASSAGRPFLGGLGTLFNAYHVWSEARATRKALDALSDHELDDIGITRADIDRIARF